MKKLKIKLLYFAILILKSSFTQTMFNTFITQNHKKECPSNKTLNASDSVLRHKDDLNEILRRNISCNIDRASEIKKLIIQGADVNTQDIGGLSTFHVAARHNNKALIELLIEKQANVNIKDNKGLTPLNYAFANNNNEIVAILINNGADINCKNNRGDTILHDVSEVVSSYINKIGLKLLLDKRPNFDIRNNKGETSLIKAIKNYAEVIVKLLLDAGISVNCKDEFGDTPLHFAAGKGIVRIIELLLNAGADKYIKNNKSKIPSDMTNTQEIKDLINYGLINLAKR